MAAAASRARLLQLCAAGALAYCSYAMCRSPLLPLFARELGADPPVVGFIVGASTLTGVALKLPAGAWSDVLGRRALLLIGAIVFAVMPFTYVPVSGLALLVVLRFVHGSASAIFGPVASASLSDVAPADRRATWLSTYSTVQGTGQAIGPVLAGYFIANARYDAAFLLAGAIALLTPAIVAGWPAPPQPSRARRSPWRQFSAGIREVVRVRLILLTSIAQAAQFILHGSLNAFLPLYASDVVGMNAAQVGWLLGMQIVTTLATRPIIGLASDRIGRRGLIVVGLGICGAAVWAISLVSTGSALIAAVLAYAVGVGVTTTTASAYITDMAPRSRYGAAHGVFGTIYDVGDAAGPILAGLFVGAWGYARMFQAMAIVPLAVSGAFLILSRPPVRGPSSERAP